MGSLIEKLEKGLKEIRTFTASWGGARVSTGQTALEWNTNHIIHM